MSSTTPSLFRFKKRGSTDDTEGPASSPKEVQIKNITELGSVTSSSTLVKRDLGFQGKLGHHVLLTYGDTMFSDASGSDQWRGMTCNSAALATEEPTIVCDPVVDGNNYPHCFLKPTEEYGEDPSVYALGVTNVVEKSDGEGIVYFLLNHRSDFKDRLLGAGVASVSIDNSESIPVPRAKRLCKYWWDGEEEPWYGDVCVLKAGEYIYAYGHAKDNPWVYLTRVKTQSAFNLNSYEYWNGESWQHQKLFQGDLNEKQSVFWQVNQGQVFWSPYHQCFLFIYCDNFWSCQILLKTASAPEGPWSEPITVHKPKPVKEGGNVYAAIPHPYYDPSGKSLIITYTNHPNTIQAVKIEF